MKRIFTLLIAFLSVWAVSNATNVVFNVTVPNPTYECWIVGNFNGWNNNEFKLTKVDDTHYTITLDDATFKDGVTQETLKYKYLSGGGDWAYVEKDAADAEISDRNYSAADVVETWAITFNPNVAPIVADIVIEIYAPKAVTELYVTGSFNGWKSPGAEGTKMNWIEADSDAGGNFFNDTIHTEDANKLAFKFASGPSWVYQQTQGDLKLTDPNAKSVFYDDITFQRIYPGAANLKTVTITATAPEGTQHMYMMGSHLGWDGASWTGTRIADGKFVFSVPNIDLMEYKYYSARDWGTEEKNADGSNAANRTLDAQIATEQTDVVANWNTGWSENVNPHYSLNFNDGLDALTKVGTPTAVDGYQGKSYMGAADSYIKIPAVDILNPEMSISFMYKVNATPDRASIIGFGNPDSIVGGTLWNNHFVQGLHLFRENSGGMQRLKAAIGTGKDASWNDGYDIAADANWANVCIVVGKGETKIYVNGQLGTNGNVAAVGASAMSKAMDLTNCSEIHLGNDANFESQGWNHHSDLSMFDNLAIYKIALSDLQVKKASWLATELQNIQASANKAYFADNALNIANYNGKLAIYDVTGKMVVNSVMQNGNMPMSLNQGIYMIRTENANYKLLVK